MDVYGNTINYGQDLKLEWGKRFWIFFKQKKASEPEIKTPNPNDLFWQLFHRSARVICERATKSYARHIPFSAPAHAQRLTKDSHNTGNFMPCSFRIVCGFFNIPQGTYINMEGICETGPTVYRPYPRRLESLTICWFNYKRQHFLLSYFKTLSTGPAGVELTTSHMTARCSTIKPPVRGQIDWSE